MKADLVLVISPEAPLMKQLGKVLGKMVTPYDFSTIERVKSTSPYSMMKQGL